MTRIPTNQEALASLGSERTAPSSTNLQIVEERAASAEVRALYEQYRARFGRPDIPGILKCFATHPPLLKSMMDIAETLLFADGLLLRRQKEMIATLISSRNGCPYCADSHGTFLRALGGSDEVFCALQTGALDSASLSRAEQALLRFALQVNEDSQSITRADIETTMQGGWTEAQVAEAVHIAALFATFNRVANAFGLPSPYPGNLINGVDE
jgi:uncharacterized peroxidase-related enzyme